MKSQREEPGLVDPDPLAVFLGVLGFMGSVASIVSYVDVRRQRRADQTADTLRLLREARDLVMSLEVDSMQMEASLQKLEFLMVEADTENHQAALVRSRMEFGAFRPLFTLHGYRKFEEVLQDLNRLIGNVINVTSRLTERIYNAGPEFSRETADSLFQLQNRLNAALRLDGTYEDGFRVYYELVAMTKEALRIVRREIQRAIDRHR